MNDSLRCLILAPTGEDAALIAEALDASGMIPDRCDNLPGLCAEIIRGAGAVIIAAEAIGGSAEEITATINEDPVWSVLPFILLTSADTPFDFDATVADLFGPRASVSIIERPCRTATLTSSVRAAVNARKRQYKMCLLLERLDRQAKDLERSNEDLNLFASIASHDLQEPLRSITSCLSMIEKRNSQQFDERCLYFFRLVIASAERMRGLIRALLEYGNVGETKTRLSKFPSELAIGEAIHNLDAMIGESGTSITIGTLPVIHADRALIAVLFQNLIGNALKYRSAKPHIEITGSESSSEWTFTVADNGIGIAPEDQDRIFKPFQRLHTSSEYKGYGIGLATCKRIADIHGGRIWVESTVGVGSRFFVSIRRTA